MRFCDWDGESRGPVRLWLPPSLSPPPDPDSVPKLLIVESYGRPRTDAEHAALKRIVAEGQAIVDKALADRDAKLKTWGLDRSQEWAARKAERAAAKKATKTEAPLSPQEIFRIRGIRKEEPEPVSEAVQEPDGMFARAPAGVDIPAAVIQAGIKVPVQHRKQIGPMCGLYSLGMAMDVWHEKDPRHPTALVQALDRRGPPGAPVAHFRFEPTSGEMIFDVAKRLGCTAKGEMYQAVFVGEVARHYGYQASIQDNATLADLYQVLDAKHPAIVAFNVNGQGDAGTPDPNSRAHYAVISGYFDHGGTRYLTARHPWSFAGTRVWKADEFAKSWANLKTTKFYGTPGDGVIPSDPLLKEPARLTLPDAGGERAQIEQALALKIIEIVPPGERLVIGRPIAKVEPLPDHV